ncbi:MAG: hypothetical protein COS08_04305 [Euryarchaeota archaeon CG01_land_8_20_14_3_00_38_12]|nr:MAG: hypothetical protein COS08_04305 [Euryarchaeota archaeon CG01_land_8_20_14_3_00_38_12]PJB21635.1 MAG: hypothetical protein CO114_04305 [Euryarchaeota archaeon CG_4_9_14_3_um_filter_38_12]
MRVVTTRVSDEFFRNLKEIEQDEHAERAEVVRRLLADAIKRWKLKRSLRMLREHKITLRKAAVIADISYVEMFDRASEAGIDIGYSLSDLEKDVK